ncbi:MAG: sigma 54-interacting transcriptional regulator [Myxococcales bacterium]|nr:sigma 54-interacting transcriptional regulator [Myxococcales bacterium]
MISSPPTKDVAKTAGEASSPGRADYLLCIEGERSWTVPLPTSGELIVGRGSEAGLRLGDESVSRAHARFLVVPDGIQVEDLDSRHGTLVNGQRLGGARAVSSGDVIAVGNARLIVHRPVRATGGRALLDRSSLIRRFEEELERSLRYRRELSLLVLRSERAFDRARIAASLVPRLRLIDAAAFLEDRELAVLLPELEADEADELAAALSGLVPGVAAGLARSPADGVDADTVLSCARAAATNAAPGVLMHARDAVQRLTLGTREVVLADPAMIGIYDLIRRLARSTLPILVQGETGVGKELAAAAVHASSTRAAGPFVAINCAAIPAELAESELFGHERGAFTGAVAGKAGQLERADGGTIFLDEIGELPLAIQAKLLRVLEAQELQRIGELKPRSVNLRVVAATNRDLAAEVEAGRFRRDLFFRLGAAQLVLPPLRDRPRDLALLAQRMFAEACERLGRRRLAWTVATTQALFLHSWPGNVRELKNAMDYAAAAAPDGAVELDVWHLPATVTGASRGAPASAASELPAPAAAARNFRPLDDEVRELERTRMIEALAATGGVQNKAAELIEMPLRTFVTKLKRYAIVPSDWK